MAASAEPMTEAGYAMKADDMAKDASRASAMEDQPAAASRMVIRNARLSIRASTPSEVAIAATRLAEQVGGFVESSDTQGVGDAVYRVDASLRVPSDRFESVLAELRSRGELLQETVTGEDVTEQHADLDARLRSQRVLEERLLTILGKVESVEDALSVESQLVQVRTQIERLDASVRGMENRVSMATITLVVESPHQVNATPAETVISRLDRAVDDAGQLFVGGLAGMIRLMGALLPVGLAFIPFGFVGRRLWVRRRRQQALMAAAMQVPPPPQM